MAVIVDAKGRVLIPQDLRDRFGLDPGTPVVVEPGETGIEIRSARDRLQAFRSLRGAINSSNRDPNAPPIDPLELKRIWEPRL